MFWVCAGCDTELADEVTVVIPVAVLVPATR